MKWKECKRLILLDYNRRRHNKLKRGNIIHYFVALVKNESFRVTFWFRILSYLQEKKFLKIILYYPLRLYYSHVCHVTGIQLPVGTKVGGGLFFSILGLSL